MDDCGGRGKGVAAELEEERAHWATGARRLAETRTQSGASHHVTMKLAFAPSLDGRRCAHLFSARAMTMTSLIYHRNHALEMVSRLFIAQAHALQDSSR